MPAFSTATYPATAGTARKVLMSDGTNFVSSTETYAAPSTSGNILQSDGTNWTSAVPEDISTVTYPSLPVYADNTAAASLAAGTLYRTSTGVLMVKY